MRLLRFPFDVCTNHFGPKCWCHSLKVGNKLYCIVYSDLWEANAFYEIYKSGQRVYGQFGDSYWGRSEKMTTMTTKGLSTRRKRRQQHGRSGGIITKLYPLATCLYSSLSYIYTRTCDIFNNALCTGCAQRMRECVQQRSRGQPTHIKKNDTLASYPSSTELGEGHTRLLRQWGPTHRMRNCI